MTNGWFESRKVAFIPVVLVFVLIGFYGIFQTLFVTCPTGGIKGIARCTSFNAVHIFPIDNPGPLDKEGNVATGDGKDEAKNRKQIAARYSGQYIWTFLAAIGTMLCFVAFVISFILVHKSASVGDRALTWLRLPSTIFPYARATILLIISLALGLLLYVYFTENYMPIMGKIFDVTIANDQAKIGMPTIRGTMRILTALTYAASFSLVGASCAVLLPRRSVKSNPVTTNESNAEKPASDTIAPNSLDPVADEMRDLRMVLYIGTFLLISGTLRMSALTQWAVSYISPSAAEAAQILNTTAIAAAGGFNTLILAAVYLPAAYILQRRAQLIAKASLKPEEQEKELKDRGLTFNFKESLPRLAAILGPLLAGPIGELFKISI